MPATPAVIVEPTLLNVSRLPAVRVSVDSKWRSDVDAPTVVTHGPPWLAVAAPGPSLPAEALTLIPAAVASRKASSTGSL